MDFKTKPSIVFNYFVGIDIPNHIKEEIYLFCKEKMSEFNPYLDWIKYHEYHITLAYIGKITPEQRERLITVSDKIILPPFKISIQGLGFFPPNKKPKSLWIGIGSGRETLNVFGNKIRDEIAHKAGLVSQDKFFPHLSIAKIKNDTNNSKMFDFIKDNWDYPFGSFKISEFHLMRISKDGYVFNHEIKLRSASQLFI